MVESQKPGIGNKEKQGEGKEKSKEEEKEERGCLSFYS